MPANPHRSAARAIEAQRLVEVESRRSAERKADIEAKRLEAHKARSLDVGRIVLAVLGGDQILEDYLPGLLADARRRAANDPALQEAWRTETRNAFRPDGRPRNANASHRNGAPRPAAVPPPAAEPPPGAPDLLAPLPPRLPGLGPRGEG